MAEQPDLTIIIVNWNSAAYLQKCLASIYGNTKDLDFEVIVIDNASFDGCDEMIRREFPQVKFIQSKENLGFAKANNLGFGHAKGRNILFLNPDTEVVGSAIKELVSVLDTTPDAGIVGAKLLNSDLSVQTSCIKAFPTILNQVLDADYLQRLFPKSRLWGMRPLFEGDSRPATVDVVCGACLMVKRAILEKVGLFTTDYFMYAEEVDLCYKVKQAGRETCYLREAIVIHHGGRSSAFRPGNNFANIAMQESRLKFMKLRRGKLYAAVYRLTIAVAAMARLCLLRSFLALTLGRFRRPTLRVACDKWLRIFHWAACL